MASVVIIDDEINAIRMLEIELKQLFPELDIIATFQNPLEALEFFKSNTSDILLIDIEMPQMNGIKFIRQTALEHTQIIFCTAYSNYAIEAIKNNALDYLLKPIDSQELYESINKALNNIKASKNPIEKILDKLDEQQSNVVKIPTKNGYTFIQKSEIIYCESESNYTHIYTTKNKLKIAKTLKYIQSCLPSENFLRIHSSYLVNIDFIQEYSRTDGGFVTLKSGKKLSVSNSKKNVFNA